MPRIQRDTCNFFTSVFTSCALIMHQTKCLLLTIWRCKNINKHKVVSLERLASGFFVLQKRHYHVLLVILMRSSPPLMKEIVFRCVLLNQNSLMCSCLHLQSNRPSPSMTCVFVQERKECWCLDWNALWIAASLSLHISLKALLSVCSVAHYFHIHVCTEAQKLKCFEQTNDLQDARFVIWIY